MSKRSIYSALVLTASVFAFGCSNGDPVSPASTDVNTDASFAASAAPGGTYEVTIINMSDYQPMSPPVVATHKSGVRMFRVGKAASPGLEAIAEDGNPEPMFNALSNASLVTDAVNIGMPLTRRGTTVASFTDQVTFDIDAGPGDRLSFATMLICTNDGFTGLDAVKLPKDGSVEYYAWGYDAGTEYNTQASEDIVDACGALGAVALPEDGNENAAVDSDGYIMHHPGITNDGDLSPGSHGWQGPVAKVIITKK